MDPWTIYSLAFAAVVLYSWGGRRRSPRWYLNCAVPLLYGGAVAWMFLEDDPLLALRVLVFGTALPVALLVVAWTGERRPGPPEQEAGDDTHGGSPS